MFGPIERCSEAAALPGMTSFVAWGEPQPGVAAGLGDHDSLQRAHLIGKGWPYIAATRAAIQVITGKRVIG